MFGAPIETNPMTNTPPLATPSEMPIELTGAQILIRAMQEQGVDTIFGYPGGAVLPIYDAIFNQDIITHVLVRHEQGAGHAAEG